VHPYTHVLHTAEAVVGFPQTPRKGGSNEVDWLTLAARQVLSGNMTVSHCHLLTCTSSSQQVQQQQ
jgi:hypothetical protein